MEKKFNPTDFTHVGKKTLDRSKRIEEQTNSFIKDYDSKLRKEQEEKLGKLNEEVLSNARFSNSSIYSKNKARVKALSEAISYTDRATRAVMTDVLSNIVENALLLDTAEYSKLNPDYKKVIRETVSSFLENGNLSEVVNDRRTLKLMDHISRSIPEIKTGVYLSEQEIIDIVKKSTPQELNTVIEGLTGDVKERVANIVVKEQDEVAEIQKEVDEVVDAGGEAKVAKMKEMGYTDEEIQAKIAQDQAAQQPAAPVGPDGQPMMDPAAAAGGAPAEGSAPGGMPQLPPEAMAELEKQGITIDQNGMPVGPDGQPVPPEALEQILGPIMGGGAPEGAPAAGGDIPPEIIAQLQQMGITQGPDGQFISADGQPVPPELIQQAVAEFQGGAPAAGPQGSEDPYADDEYLQYQQGQATPGFSAGSAPQQSTVVPQTANKNTAVEVSPDGTVKVNIVRERFYREVPRQGILESLALNEANDMIAAGKKYNSDLAIANALTQLTILETFNATGLMPISELDYKRMLNLSVKKKTIKEAPQFFQYEDGTKTIYDDSETFGFDNEGKPIRVTSQKPGEKLTKYVTPPDATSYKDTYKKVVGSINYVDHDQASTLAQQPGVVDRRSFKVGNKDNQKVNTNESETLGSVAAEPVHDEKAAVEHTPEVENKDVFPAEEHKQAEEVKEVIVKEETVESWKQKALKALNK